MQYLSVTEYERIPRNETNKKFLSQLQAFDELWAASNGQTVFDWNDRRFIKAKNYVGVIAVPGGAIEILPKIDRAEGEPGKVRSQHNLLYMLTLTKKIVGEERDLASVGKQRMPLLEQLISVFAERTLSELKKGVDHNYVTREENLHCIKGKLLVECNAVVNVGHHERAFCSYDDFLPDTPINKILKASCRKLLMRSTSLQAQKKLREIIVLLDGVSDIQSNNHHFPDVHYNRNTERFKPLVHFASLVLQGMSPAWAKGKETSFALLFPMEMLFEEFVARYVWRYADEFEIKRDQVHAQAVGRRSWLLRRESDGTGKFRLKPDLIVDDLDGIPRLILDTKWKHLKSDEEDSRNGVSQSDIYQLYAYAHRYECQENVLLYPKVEGVTAKSYRIEGPYCSHKIRIELIDLNLDLMREGEAFRGKLRKVMFGENGDASMDAGHRLLTTGEMD